MRRNRLILYVAGALGLVAAAWSIVWLVGRSDVETRLVDLVTEADAEGWTLTHGNPEISGFPLGYDVVLPDAALVHRGSGLIARLPEVNAIWEGTDADQVKLLLPDSFKIEMPVTEARRTRDPSLPEKLQFDGTARNAQVVLRQDGGLVGVISGDEIRLVLEQTDIPTSIEAALRSFVAELSDDLAAPIALRAEEIALSGTSSTSDGPEAVLKTQAASFALDLLLDEAAFNDVIYGGVEGTYRAQYTYGSVGGTLDISKDPLGMDGKLGFSTGEGAGDLIASAGILDVTADNRDVAWSLTGPSQDWGAVTIARTEFGYTVPMSPTEMPQPGRLKVGLEALKFAQQVWDEYDPAGKLDRTPGNLALDISMTLRLMARMDRLPAGMQPPYEIANVMVNQAIVQALGAEVQAAGDVEMIQPAAIPVGQLNIQAHGLSALISGLAETGLLPPEMQEYANAILQVYARPGEGDDSWQTELRIGRAGMSVNGLPVQ
ncbi:MAG: DUF2125 domain-containing protein [Paracoccaceae bacterium]